MRNGADPEVEIEVDAHGNIRYGWAVLHVARDQIVTWRFNGEFTVFFPVTPFADGGLALFGKKGESGRFEASSTPFAKDARGVYRYHVALRPAAQDERAGAAKIFLDVGCPEIIVGR